jgi:hypothetical protein
LFLNANSEEDIENTPGFYLLKSANPDLTSLKGESVGYEILNNPKERICKLGEKH